MQNDKNIRKTIPLWIQDIVSLPITLLGASIAVLDNFEVVLIRLSKLPLIPAQIAPPINSLFLVTTKSLVAVPISIIIVVPGYFIYAPTASHNKSAPSCLGFSSFICNETISCIQSGIVYGHTAMIEGLIKKFKNELALDDANIILTGGYAKIIKDLLEIDCMYDENILLDGLFYIYQKNKNLINKS